MSSPIKLFLLLLLLYPVAHSASLSIKPSQAPDITPQPKFQIDQLPQSRIAYGKNDIAFAWFANPTTRYRHAILGDHFEAEALVVETYNDQRFIVELPTERVFEDLEPRIVDIDGNGIDEIIVIESDKQRGASLAIYGIRNHVLIKKASTPFIGRSNRWLNPLGVGDFDGDGNNEIALVQTPHIGGILRLYNWNGEKLNLFAEQHGVSTHKIGSTALKLGTVIPTKDRDQFLLPNQSHNELLLLEYTAKGWQQHTKLKLPERMTSELTPSGTNTWRVQINNQRYYEIKLSKS